MRLASDCKERDTVRTVTAVPEPERPCPACESHQSTRAFEVHGFDHVECSRCRTLFVSPLPDDETIRKIYIQPDYHAAVEDSADRMRAEAQARAQVLRDRGVRRLLEIGCGAGYFLEACLDLGIQAEGVDGGPTGARAAARGLIVHDTWVDDFEPGEQFDAIALWEVIEHLPRPISALRRLRTFVRPGGALALSTPSWTGLPAKILGRRFPMITPPEHLSLFSRMGLGGMLRGAGFEPFRWTSFSGLKHETLQRNFQRYFVGTSRVGAAVAGVLATATHRPMQWVDRAGLGTSFELYAEAV